MTTPQFIGPWVIDGTLGKGGMASVFRCHHKERADEKRAVKVIYNREGPESRRRFSREAEILYALRHPAVVRMVDMNMTGEYPYLVMELVEGENLVDRLRKGALPLDLACSAFRQLASGLQHAHELGIRHRDVKPANIMLCPDGSVRLLDFGIAFLEGGTRLTTAGVALGTVRYMPPEVLTTRNPDGIKWDVYSLGVVFFECLTGVPGFIQPNPSRSNAAWIELLRMKQKMPPLDPGPRFPDAIRDVCRRATHPDPARRLSSMAGFRAVLEWAATSPRTGTETLITGSTEAEGAAPSGAMDLPTRPPVAPEATTAPMPGEVPTSPVAGGAPSLTSPDLHPLHRPATGSQLSLGIRRLTTAQLRVREYLTVGIGFLLFIAVVGGAVSWWLAQAPPAPPAPTVAPPPPGAPPG